MLRIAALFAGSAGFLVASSKPRVNKEGTKVVLHEYAGRPLLLKALVVGDREVAYAKMTRGSIVLHETNECKERVVTATYEYGVNLSPFGPQFKFEREVEFPCS